MLPVLVLIADVAKPGRGYVEQARAALSAEDVPRATEVGRRLTMDEALDLARVERTAV